MSSEFFECLKQHVPAGLLSGQCSCGKAASRTLLRAVCVFTSRKPFFEQPWVTNQTSVGLFCLSTSPAELLWTLAQENRWMLVIKS